MRMLKLKTGSNTGSDTLTHDPTRPKSLTRDPVPSLGTTNVVWLCNFGYVNQICGQIIWLCQRNRWVLHTNKQTHTHIHTLGFFGFLFNRPIFSELLQVRLFQVRPVSKSKRLETGISPAALNVVFNSLCVSCVE